MLAMRAVLDYEAGSPRRGQRRLDGAVGSRSLTTEVRGAGCIYGLQLGLARPATPARCYP